MDEEQLLLHDIVYKQLGCPIAQVKGITSSCCWHAESSGAQAFEYPVPSDLCRGHAPETFRGSPRDKFSASRLTANAAIRLKTKAASTIFRLLGFIGFSGGIGAARSLVFLRRSACSSSWAKLFLRIKRDF